MTAPAPFPLAEGQQIAWEPKFQTQIALIQCPVFEVFFGGARGGGKTESSIGDWLEHSSMYGELAIGIFVRRKFKQLSEVIARTKQIFPKLGATYNETRAEWKMANGARLKFVYLERDSDAEEYQGHSYTRVYIEEATNFPDPYPINLLRATLRSGAGVHCAMRLTGNPGGPGHHWVKKRYIDPCPKGYKIITETEELVIDGKKTLLSIDRVYIPSKISDNTEIMRNDPTYILRLRQVGSESMVKAWLHGDWDVIDGAFFDEWDEEKHVLPMDWEKRIPASALRFRAMDWGSAKPFSVGWYALSDGTWGLPKGALLKYREWYGASDVNKGLKMTADLVAKGIVEREKGERISYGVADPAIFIRDGGPSIAETMAIHRCSWRRADNKRISGAECFRQRLTGDIDPSTGSITPMLYFLETCVDTIRTIPILQHDDKKSEDVDTDLEDHAYDETRYAIMSRPWIPRVPQPEGSGLPKLPSELTVDEIIKRNAERRRRLQEGE